MMNGPLALIICSVLWSTGGIFFKNIELNGVAIAGIRSLISGSFMLLVTRQGFRFSIRDDKGHLDKESTIVYWLAAIFYALTMILFVAANKLTTSANAILLQYTCPVYIILLAPFLTGEKNRPSDYVTVVGVMLGIVLFFADGSFSQMDLKAVISLEIFLRPFLESAMLLRQSSCAAAEEIRVVQWHFLT